MWLQERLYKLTQIKWGRYNDLLKILTCANLDQFIVKFEDIY